VIHFSDFNELDFVIFYRICSLFFFTTAEERNGPFW